VVTAADREDELSGKFALLAPVLDEHQRRLWMAGRRGRPEASASTALSKASKAATTASRSQIALELTV
jgi:hypothetical protein